MCDLWKKSLGSGKPLPAEFSSFLRYREDNKPKPKPKAAAEKPAEDADEPEG